MNYMGVDSMGNPVLVIDRTIPLGGDPTFGDGPPIKEPVLQSINEAVFTQSKGQLGWQNYTGDGKLYIVHHTANSPELYYDTNVASVAIRFTVPESFETANEKPTKTYRTLTRTWLVYDQQYTGPDPTPEVPLPRRVVANWTLTTKASGTAEWTDGVLTSGEDIHGNETGQPTSYTDTLSNEYTLDNYKADIDKEFAKQDWPEWEAGGTYDRVRQVQVTIPPGAKGYDMQIRSKYRWAYWKHASNYFKVWLTRTDTNSTDPTHPTTTALDPLEWEHTKGEEYFVDASKSCFDSANRFFTEPVSIDFWDDPKPDEWNQSIRTTLAIKKYSYVKGYEPPDDGSANGFPVS